MIGHGKTHLRQCSRPGGAFGVSKVIKHAPVNPAQYVSRDSLEFGSLFSVVFGTSFEMLSSWRKHNPTSCHRKSVATDALGFRSKLSGRL